MGRCHLKGRAGDEIHVVLCAARFNIRSLLRMIVRKPIFYQINGIFGPSLINVLIINMGINIFVVHRPFQLLISQLIIEQYINNHGDKNILFFEGDSIGQVIDYKLWDTINQVDYCATVFGKAKNVSNIIHESVLKIINHNYGEIDIYFSDIAWAMNNRLFFSKRLLKRVNYHILCDGLGTYMDPGQSRLHRFKNVIKMILGYLGLSAVYTPYSGGLMGMDQPRIKAIFCFRPDLLPAAYLKKSHALSFFQYRPDVKQKVLSGDCLFLDQPYKELLKEKEWLKIRSDTVNYIKSIGYSRIFYKKHPICSSDYSKDLLGIDLDIIENDDPIEYIMRNNRFKHVISYNSTSLLNLKLIYGDEIIATSLFYDRLSNLGPSGGKHKTSSSDLFKKVGVIVVNS